MVHVIKHIPAPTTRQFIKNGIIMATCLFIGWKCDRLCMDEMDSFKGKSRTFGDYTGPEGPTVIPPQDRRFLIPK